MKLKRILMIIFIIGLNGLVFGQILQISAKNQLFTNQKEINTQSYVSREPISVIGNEDLKNQFPGHAGTVDDPIRIEGFNITDPSKTLIDIQYTTLFLRISNNYIDGTTPQTAERSGYFGIQLSNVIHVTVENNFVTNNTNDGIGIYSSQNNTLVNNTFVNNGLNGIRLETADNHKIINNTISNCIEGGIFASSCNNSMLSGNTMIENSISMYTGCNNTMVKNTIYNSEYPAIGLMENSHNNTIHNNTIHDNLDSGIALDFASNTTIAYNLIYLNNHYGITIAAESENNSIYVNDFADNHPGNPQASDNGINNVFRDNYWKDWTGSGSYALAGSAGNQDSSPHAEPYFLPESTKTPGMTSFIVAWAIFVIIVVRNKKRRTN